MDANKNKELQSRREFFKSAAKVALPVLGAVVLSHLPLTARAAPSGCHGSCIAACMNGCTGGCKHTCNTTCQYMCKESCSTTARH